MTKLVFISLCNFGNFLAPVLFAVHTVSSLNPGQQNETYESYLKKRNQKKAFFRIGFIERLFLYQKLRYKILANF